MTGSSASDPKSTTGKDFRFEPVASEAERSKKVKLWRDWWKKTSEDLLGGNT